MTVSHERIHWSKEQRKQPVVFAALGGFTCSICAPNTMTAEAVELFAMQELGTGHGAWHWIDKAKFGLGSPTPNPCNQSPDRTHWFLLAATVLDRMGNKQ